jgi:hypothetical protein
MMLLIAQEEYEEQYISLLCQFEPQSVLGFMETLTSYNPDHCLSVTMQYGTPID